jgi:hypothetical protein
VCCDFLYEFFSAKFLILRTAERDIIKLYIGLHVKYTLALLDFSET